MCAWDFGRGEIGNKLEIARMEKNIARIKTPCNFDVWIKKDLWTIKDASLVVLGIDPDAFNGMESLYYHKRDGNRLECADREILGEIIIVGESIRKIFIDIQHSDIMGKFHFVGAANAHETLVEPYVFCKWAQGKGYTLPAKLVQWLEAVAEINPLEKWKEVIANINDIKKKRALETHLYS